MRESERLLQEATRQRVEIEAAAARFYGDSYVPRVPAVIPQPIVREVLRALGVLTCADCGQVTAILGRRARVVENPK